MGVFGLWELLKSNGHPVKLEALEGKRIAVDANVWLFKFIRGFREKDEAVRIDSHKLGLFSRICKLLFYKIKPVFVFDGPAPILKRKTLERRKDLRTKHLLRAQDASKKLIINQLKEKYPNIKIQEIEFNFPDLQSDRLLASEQLTDEDAELFRSVQKEIVISDSEYEDYDDEKEVDLFKGLFRPQNTQDSCGSNSLPSPNPQVEPHKRLVDDIDIYSPDFKNLPPEVRHEILTDIKEFRRKIRSRALPEDANSFSSLQLERLKNRRMVQEKIEECEKEIQSSMYEDTNVENRRIVLESYRVQSNPTSRIVYLKNLIDQKQFNQKSITSDEKGDVKAQEENSPELKPLLPSIKDRLKQSASANSFKTVQASLKSKTSYSSNNDVHEVACLSEISSNSSSDATIIEESQQPSLVVETLITSSSDEDEIIDMKKAHDQNVYHIDTDDDEIQVVTPTEPVKQESGLTAIETQKLPKSLDTSIEVVYESHVQRPNLEDTHKSEHKEKNPTDEYLLSIDKNTVTRREPVLAELMIDGAALANAFQNVSDFSFDTSKHVAEHHEPLSAGKPETVEDRHKTPDTLAPQTSSSSQYIEMINIDQRPYDDLVTAQSLEQMKQHRRAVATDIRMASKVTDKVIEESKELLTLFGIPYIVAPGEAEAQCAAMERLGLTEGTITDDSDIWLFGAQNVYRYFFSTDKYMLQYKMRDIEFHVRLTRENLVCFAMLVGSDYTDGIQGVGPVTALEILSEFPGNGLDPLIKLKHWKEKYLKDKERVPGSKKRQSFLKFKLPEQFPSQVIFDGYMQPLADMSNEAFSWSMPKANELKDYAMRELGWSEKQVEEKLEPVMKRLQNKRSQPTIDSFFFNTQANLNPDRFRSKRVNRALGKLISSQEKVEEHEKKVDKEDAIQARHRKKAKEVMDREKIAKKKKRNIANISGSKRAKK